MTIASGASIVAGDHIRIPVAPTATSTNGTPTAVNSATEVKDAVIGDYTVNLTAGVRYRVHYVGVKLSLNISANFASIRVRLKQNTSPTITDTLLVDWQTRVNATGGAGQESQHVSKTFTVGVTGTYLIGAFTQTPAVASQQCTPVGDRELYIEIMG